MTTLTNVYNKCLVKLKDIFQSLFTTASESNELCKMACADIVELDNRLKDSYKYSCSAIVRSIGGADFYICKCISFKYR